MWCCIITTAILLGGVLWAQAESNAKVEYLDQQVQEVRQEVVATRLINQRLSEDMAVVKAVVQRVESALAKPEKGQ